MAQNDTEYLVGGYRFATEQDAELAKEEKQRVTLLDVKLDYNNISSVARVYEKAVRHQVFVTPIGMNYLSRLQQILVENDRPEGLLAIPVSAPIKTEAEKSEEEDAERQATDSGQEEALTAESADADKDGELLSEEPQRGTVRLTILVENLERQLEQKDKQLRRIAGRAKRGTALCFVLAALIVVLFVIALTGENANALNYKRVLTDRYASWEQELTQREEAVRQKEQELKISEWEEE